ncbi:MAG TPA: hypothetical protein VGN57_20970 [Pirellulaceae bacterium]|jgi:hypothetical protein|nr:hypothetical protein [Pirellulaceae bacterium]
MRAFIPHLLNVAAAFALSFLLVGVFLPVHGHPAWTRPPMQFLRLRGAVEWAEIGETPLSVAEIEEWLAGNASAELAFRMPIVPEKDPWNRPYRCVVIADAQGADRFGFYSTGRDGVSATGGNDPDDINSWSDSKTRYYEREWWAWTLFLWTGLSAAATPVVYHFAGMLCSILAACFGGRTKDEPPS